MHGGSASGVTTLIVAALEDGLGIVALTNVDDKTDILKYLVFKLAQRALGAGNTSSTPPVNNSVTSRSILPRHADAGVIARADSSGTPSYPDPTGTYCSTGYGTLVLCSLGTTIPACKGVQNDIRAVIDSGSVSPNPPDLFTYWGGVWDKHGYFAYTNGSSYSIFTGTIYPQGYGKNSTAFTTLSGPYDTAKFVVENGKVVGFGFNDDVSDLPVKPGGSVKETSQVWFDRKD